VEIERIQQGYNIKQRAARQERAQMKSTILSLQAQLCEKDEQDRLH